LRLFRPSVNCRNAALDRGAFLWQGRAKLESAPVGAKKTEWMCLVIVLLAALAEMIPSGHVMRGKRSNWCIDGTGKDWPNRIPGRRATMWQKKPRAT
jgi:hypothetical protein